MSFEKRVAEELYDVNADPYNIKNLAQSPQYATKGLSYKKLKFLSHCKSASKLSVKSSILAAKFWGLSITSDSNKLTIKDLRAAVVLEQSFFLS